MKFKKATLAIAALISTMSLPSAAQAGFWGSSHSGKTACNVWIGWGFFRELANVGHQDAC